VYSVSADIDILAGLEFGFGTLNVLGIGIGAAEIGYTSNFDFVNFGLYADIMGGLGLYKDEGIRISDWAVAFDWRTGGLAEIYVGPEKFNLGIGAGGGVGLKANPYLRITLPVRLFNNVFKPSINYDTFFDHGWRAGFSLLINIPKFLD
jgi:hypothetical protein